MRWIFLLLFPVLAGAQPHTAVADFNQDGTQDSISWEWDCGSSSCAFFYGFFDGRTLSSAEGMMEQPFSDFIDVVGLPKNLDYDQPTWERIFSTIFNKDSIRPNTPSLDWYISAYMARANADTTETLQTIFRVTPQWHARPVQTPTFSFRYLTGDTLAALKEQVWVGGSNQSETAMVLYYGQNHGENLETTASVLVFQEDTLLQTPHGLIWLKDEQYAWILAHDHALFGGPGKLRWPSIQEVWIYEDLLVVLILNGIVDDYHFLLVHPESGTIATLFHDGLYASDELEYFQLSNLFQLHHNGKLLTYDIPKLGRQLQKLSTD
jgi:hypothetical protein